MLQRLLAVGLVLATQIPFYLLGITATFVGLLSVLGIGPYQKSTTFLVLFTLCAPLAILLSAMLGYGLLLAALRALGWEQWFERHAPSGQATALDAPFNWVRALVHRAMPPVKA